MADALAALHASSDHLFQTAGALDAETIRSPAYPSEWTIADVLSHLGSSAVIFAARFDAAVAGREFDGDQQAIWDEWNAKSPDAQVADALAADRALLDRIDALPDAARPAFRFAMGPMEFGFDGFIGLRLNESVLHTWDVAVALDPQATLLAEAVPFVVDRVELTARFTGQASDIGTMRVRTDDPRRDLVLELGADVSIVSADGDAPPDLELPAEAFVRLVYGRLDPDHTPDVSDSAAISRLRDVFPGP